MLTAVDSLATNAIAIDEFPQSSATPHTETPLEESVQEETAKSEDAHAVRSPVTLELAAHDVRWVMEQQKEQNHLLTTKLNILFVVNGALLTSLTLTKLVLLPSVFSFGEILGFLINFTLLIRAFLPRQVAVSPNLEDTKFLERYLLLAPQAYQLKMMVNQVAIYQMNKQRIDDISQSLTYAAYVTWTVAMMLLLHMVSSYFIEAV